MRIWSLHPRYLDSKGLVALWRETRHLLSKLKIRDALRYEALINESKLKTHPLFNIIEGKVEDWEKFEK